MENLEKFKKFLEKELEEAQKTDIEPSYENSNNSSFCKETGIDVEGKDYVEDSLIKNFWEKVKKIENLEFCLEQIKDFEKQL